MTLTVGLVASSDGKMNVEEFVQFGLRLMGEAKDASGSALHEMRLEEAGRPKIAKPTRAEVMAEVEAIRLATVEEKTSKVSERRWTERVWGGKEGKREGGRGKACLNPGP